MSEFIAVLGGSGGKGQTVEHSFSRVLSGEIEDVRARLIYAVELFDYRVLSEQPPVIKRNKAASCCSFDVLKCVKSVSIGLKALNPTSTVVTFDYEIQNQVVTKGDRQTVEREAEAIIALATSRQATMVCAACGTNNSSDSRFCRVCGTPTTLGEPAAVEVLRLTAGARYAHQHIIAGLVTGFGIAAMTLPLIFLSSKGPLGGLILLVVGVLLSMLWALYGLWRLHRTLNPGKGAKEIPAGDIPQILSPAKTAALPPQPAHASVTEGTTAILPVIERKQIVVPVRPQKADTAEI